MKKILIGAGVIIFVALLVVIFTVRPHEDRNTWSVENPVPSKEFTLLFVGDIMLDRDVERSVNENGRGDPNYPFARIADELHAADLTIGNLEGPISDKGVNVGSQYSFRMGPKFIEGLTFAGLDVLSLANNHMFDYTAAALVDTVNRLQEAGIATAGAGRNHEEANTAAVKELPDGLPAQAGTRIAFLSYTNLYPESLYATEDRPGLPARAGISDPDLEAIKSAIRDLRQANNLVVLLWHWGDEYQTRSNTEQKQIARELIDAGADLIVGHHPHVAQEIEIYKEKYIAYSLGNFVFDQSFSTETMRGLMLQVTIKGGEIKSVEPIQIQISPTFQPFIP